MSLEAKCMHMWIKNTSLLKLWNCFKFGVYAEFNSLEGDIF